MKNEDENPYIDDDYDNYLQIRQDGGPTFLEFVQYNFFASVWSKKLK